MKKKMYTPEGLLNLAKPRSIAKNRLSRLKQIAIKCMCSISAMIMNRHCIETMHIIFYVLYEDAVMLLFTRFSLFHFYI